MKAILCTVCGLEKPTPAERIKVILGAADIVVYFDLCVEHQELLAPLWSLAFAYGIDVEEKPFRLPDRLLLNVDSDDVKQAMEVLQASAEVTTGTPPANPYTAPMLPASLRKVPEGKSQPPPKKIIRMPMFGRYPCPVCPEGAGLRSKQGAWTHISFVHSMDWRRTVVPQISAINACLICGVATKGTRGILWHFTNQHLSKTLKENGTMNVYLRWVFHNRKRLNLDALVKFSELRPENNGDIFKDWTNLPTEESS